VTAAATGHCDWSLTAPFRHIRQAP
jgi:hypothetical protein